MLSLLKELAKMFTTYEDALIKIERLIEVLSKNGINAQSYRHFEHDYYATSHLIEAFRDGTHEESPLEYRVSLISLLDIANIVLKVSDHSEFNKLIPHLKLLENGSPALNKHISKYSKSGKQDSDSDKIIELIVGASCLDIGSDVDLDDPVNSSGGTNPDVIFTHNHNRISFACKKLHANKPQTIIDNITKAADQIQKSDCNFGYIVLNVQNIIAHMELDVNNLKHDHMDVASMTIFPSFNSVRESILAGGEQVNTALRFSKVRPCVLLYGYTTALMNSFIGYMPTSIKTINLLECDHIGSANDYDKYLALRMNHYVQSYIY